MKGYKHGTRSVFDANDRNDDANDGNDDDFKIDTEIDTAAFVSSPETQLLDADEDEGGDFTKNNNNNNNKIEGAW